MRNYLRWSTCECGTINSIINKICKKCGKEVEKTAIKGSPIYQQQHRKFKFDVDPWMKIFNSHRKLPQHNDKYTVEDMRRVSAEYDENFEKLIRAVGTPDHDIYLKEENRLNSLGIKIRYHLGLLIHIPNCSNKKTCKGCRRTKCNLHPRRVNETPKLTTTEEETDAHQD
jgi:hypothetical protein